MSVLNLYPIFSALKNIVHKFNSVIRDFCDGFDNPKARNAKEIVKFNEDNAEIAMPERAYSSLIFVHRSFKTNIDLAYPDQKELITSSNSTLTDEECETAAKELQRLAGLDGLGKFMDDNNLDLIVTNSDCSLVSFTACSGEIAY
jgi:amidase